MTPVQYVWKPDYFTDVTKKLASNLQIHYLYSLQSVSEDLSKI